MGKLFRNDFDVCISQDSQGLILKGDICADFLVHVLKDRVANFKNTSQGSTIQGVTKRQLAELQIPLPPLEVQREIVAEIEGYQRVIEEARAVMERMEGNIREAVGNVWSDKDSKGSVWGDTRIRKDSAVISCRETRRP